MTKLKYTKEQLCIEAARGNAATLRNFARAQPHLKINNEVIDLVTAALEDAIKAIFAKAQLGATVQDRNAIEALAMAQLGPLSLVYQVMMSSNALDLRNNSEWKNVIKLFSYSAEKGSYAMLDDLCRRLNQLDAEFDAMPKQGEQNAN